MPDSVVLVDTGPRVAFLNRGDRFHDWAVQQLGGISGPLHTCEAVISEACFLLRRGGGDAGPVLELLDRGIVVPSFQLAANTTRVASLMRRYEDQGISLADACIVRMSELSAGCLLLTLDSGFRVYRRNGRQVIPVAIPPGL